jgi:capsular exopolysaccharide synthesis family protein
MSRIFEALKKSGTSDVVEEPGASSNASELIEQSSPGPVALGSCGAFTLTSTPQERLVCVTDEHGLAAEKVRVLATKLRHIAARRPLKKLLVTSSMKGEGKSIISANLAITLAKHTQARVLLLDGDLRQPTLDEKLGCATEKSLAEWWSQNTPVDQILRKESTLPLWFLPAGKFAGQPLEVLQSSRFSDLVGQLNELFDWIVIDSPPLNPLADSRVLGSLSDGVMVVVRERFTQVEMLNQAIEAIEPKKLLGLVMNDTTVSESRYFPAYYQYAPKSSDKQAAATA